MFYFAINKFKTMVKELEVDVRDKILEHLKNDDRKLKWLQRQTEIPYGTLYSTFKLKNIRLNEEKLGKINLVLGTDFKL